MWNLAKKQKTAATKQCWKFNEWIFYYASSKIEVQRWSEDTTVKMYFYVRGWNKINSRYYVFLMQSGFWGGGA